MVSLPTLHARPDRTMNRKLKNLNGSPGRARTADPKLLAIPLSTRVHLRYSYIVTLEGVYEAKGDSGIITWVINGPHIIHALPGLIHQTGEVL